MSEMSYGFDQPSESPRPVIPEADHGTAEINMPSVSYENVANVPLNFGENPDNLKIHYLMEMNADDTIVIVGDEVIYYGGPLHYQEVPNLKVRATNKYFNRQDLLPVKAIMEGKRIIAYATDYEKASLFINQFKKAVA